MTHRKLQSEANCNKTFLTTTKREDFWKNDAVAPYTAPCKDNVPGPGQYSMDKKTEDVKNRVLLEDALHVPFGVSDERNCLRKQKKNNEPGPGQYIDISNPNNSSVCKSLMKFSNERGFAEAHGVVIGPFGATSKRFEKNYFEPKNGPAPGQYVDQIKKIDAELNITNTVWKPKNESVYFKSTTGRFLDLEKSKPTVQILSKNRKINVGPSVGDYELKQDWVKQNRASDYDVFGNKQIGFETTASRFHYNQIFHGVNLPFTPGPGQYAGPTISRPKSVPKNQNTRFTVTFNSGERRFSNNQNNYVKKVSTTNNVGPGSYINTESSMVKKTFNMSLDNSYFA